MSKLRLTLMKRANPSFSVDYIQGNLDALSSKSHTSLHWKWEGACLWILSCRSFGAGLGEPWKMQSESLWARGRALCGHTVCYLETCLSSPGAKYTQVFLHFLLLTWHLRCAV